MLQDVYTQKQFSFLKIIPTEESIMFQLFVQLNTQQDKMKSEAQLHKGTVLFLQANRSKSKRNHEHITDHLFFEMSKGPNRKSRQEMEGWLTSQRQSNCFTVICHRQSSEHPVESELRGQNQVQRSVSSEGTEGNLVSLFVKHLQGRNTHTNTHTGWAQILLRS